MTQDKKVKIEFAPGCFDNFDGTQEELDGLIALLEKMAESGELEELSEPLTDEFIEDLSEEEQESVLRQLEGLTNERNKTLN